MLTNAQVMERPLTVEQAWGVYDRWLSDPRVEFYPEPKSVDNALRQATAPFFNQASAKTIGDCYLLAFSRETDTTLVTFDRALTSLAARTGYLAFAPA